MFTLEQIKSAHSKVKSGADFPNYIQDIIKLGVTAYETFVRDGHTLYKGNNGYAIQAGPRYEALKVNNTSDASTFQKDLKEHQQGKTDFPTFCRLSAAHGVEKWRVDTQKMTCTYFDKAGNEMLKEIIPG